ncbi:YihY/virulence factor BrkB family protein [Pseudonocardia sp.]|uniref:YihY/virulence factor BrkB family protein n=1 Tax=Pseudonocardia sp. TaxID=60912 RepID=UPI0026154BE0|nr:YihY/virulence factor BrkB family protein [Pseudonocardia sp.]
MPSVPSAPPSAARRLTVRVARRAWDDDILSASASAAFWQTLSLPPLLLGVFGILGYVEGWFGADTVTAAQQWIIEATSGVFSPNAVEEIIVPTVADVLTTVRGEVVSVGFLLSFWSGSSAMSAFVDSITRAHDQYPVRGFLWQRTLSVLLYVMFLAMAIVLLPLVTLDPTRLEPFVPRAWEPGSAAVLAAASGPVVALVLVLALTTLYRVALPFKPPWRRVLPGALLAAVVFVACVTGLRLYLDWITSTGYTYGALAAPIAFLLATFFVAFSIIVGAHLNAAVQAVWPTTLRRWGRAQPERVATVRGESTVELAELVRDHPDAAASELGSLGYVVLPPQGDPDTTNGSEATTTGRRSGPPDGGPGPTASGFVTRSIGSA